MAFRLYYTEAGAGEPLILLHGNGESGDYFSEQIPFFSKKYQVIVPDTRGHGRSPRGNKPFTLSQFVEDLRDFMDSLLIEKAHLLGFSDGGNIALLFALQYPERVLSLILNGANLFPQGLKASVLLPIVWEYKIDSLFANRSAKAKKNAEMLRLMVQEPDIKFKDLTALDIRVLVITGTRDMIRASHTKLIAEHLKNAESVLIEGDHFIAKKNSAAFNRAVECFLDG